jgi:hypothetical protein
MALWGIPGTGAIWGSRLQLDQKNWTRAHTELGDYHDRVKFTPKDNPLQREPHVREQQNHPRRAAAFAQKELDEELSNIARGYPGLASAGHGEITNAKITALQIDAARGKHKERIAKAHQEFVENFDNWLRGNGRPEEYERAGMHDLAVKARKLKVNGGDVVTLTPISHHPSVRKYIDRKIERKIEYDLEIAKRRLRQGRTGKPGRELTVKEAWELYKFAVHGLDPQGPEVVENTGLPANDDYTREWPEPPLIEELPKTIDKRDEDDQANWTLGAGRPPPGSPPNSPQGPAPTSTPAGPSGIIPPPTPAPVSPVSPPNPPAPPATPAPSPAPAQASAPVVPVAQDAVASQPVAAAQGAAVPVSPAEQEDLVDLNEDLAVQPAADPGKQDESQRKADKEKKKRRETMLPPPKPETPEMPSPSLSLTPPKPAATPKDLPATPMAGHPATMTPTKPPPAPVTPARPPPTFLAAEGDESEVDKIIENNVRLATRNLTDSVQRLDNYKQYLSSLSTEAMLESSGTKHLAELHNKVNQDKRILESYEKLRRSSRINKGKDTRVKFRDEQ